MWARGYFLRVRSNGIAIRAIREAQNMSLPALARRAGIDRGYLSRLERGQIERPAEAKVQAIAAALTVPTAAITHEGADVPATEAKRKAPPTAETGAPPAPLWTNWCTTSPKRSPPTAGCPTPP